MSGRIALITGAARGIGAETARVFAAAGWRVALTARRAEQVAGLAAEIGPQAMALACDVASWDQTEAAVAAVAARWGGLDLVVNNAGVVTPIGGMDAVDPAAWGQTVDVNLKGVFHGMRAALPVMLAGGGGTVLTISSGAAHNPAEGWSAYCASKAGAAMLTRSLDLEFRARGIRAMGLSPGTVATDMQREIKASGINRVSKLEWSDHVPPDWPARALLWMADPGADAHLGEELSLREDWLRRAIGLI